MSLDEILSENFSSEERHRGNDLFAKDLVVISSGSDTQVRAYIKNVRVSLTAETVGDELFLTSCTCPVAAKGRPCRHIWAVLLKLNSKSHDFLEGKQRVEVGGGSVASVSDSAANAGAAAKQKQADYRKQQYEKQKTRAKETRQKKRQLQNPEAEQASIYPAPVQAALAYFVKNGFLDNPKALGDLSEVLAAKKSLAQVFHPDKGGSHDEIIELNRQFTIIHDYLKS
jgi:uncharacterized Zn finger protein